MYTCPWFHATNMANATANHLVQLGIGGWQVLRPGVKVCRERASNILTVTDIMETGLDAADFALAKAHDGNDCIDAGFVLKRKYCCDIFYVLLRAKFLTNYSRSRGQLSRIKYSRLVLLFCTICFENLSRKN